jgi:hypothetical protein
MKIRPVGADLLHADGQTDMTKSVVAFRNFAKAPKSGSFNGSMAHDWLQAALPALKWHFLIFCFLKILIMYRFSKLTLTCKCFWNYAI